MTFLINVVDMKCSVAYIQEDLSLLNAKRLVTELTHLHVQSAWRSRRESVRVTGLAACRIYFSKKKKKITIE